MHLPPGFNTVAPYFFVEDADRFVQFLVQGLGGVEVLRTRTEQGQIINVQVRLGDSTVMASEAGGGFPPMPTSCYLYVEDADAATQTALGAGGKLVMELTDMPYGDRQSGVRDPHGNLWWISQRLVEGPYTA